MRRASTTAGAALVALGALAGCGKPHKKHHHHHDAGPAEDPWARAEEPPPGAACERLPFATSIPVPEASGAAWLHEDGGDRVLVVGDSGRSGAYVEIGAEDGRVLRRGALPLGDGAGDDVEGLATDGQRLWGLTSAGWMRAWVKDGDGYRLVLGPYPIEHRGPCKMDSVNCGHDFEGLCLRPAGTVGADGCVGYAAAKAEGALYCLTVAPAPAEDDGKGPGPRLMLSVREGHHAPRPLPAITAKGALADCAIASDGAVWTGDNMFGGGTVRRLDAPAWEGPLGDGFPEAMALAPGGIVYRFSDAGGEPSLAGRYRCAAAAGVGPAASTIGSAAP